MSIRRNVRRHHNILEELSSPQVSPRSIKRARSLIRAVYSILDRNEWGSDTTVAIADILSRYGLTIREPD